MTFINALASSSRAAARPVGAPRRIAPLAALQYGRMLRDRPRSTPRGARSFGSSTTAPVAAASPAAAAAASADPAPTVDTLNSLSPSLEALESISPAALGIIDTLSLHLLSSPLSAGATIILLTVLVRGCVTFPVSVWQRRRAWRIREKVQPEMKRLNDVLAGSLARQMRKEGKGWDEYKAELKSQLAAHQLALHKKYNTHPLITLLTPLAVHVPILVTLSLTIRGALDANPAVLEALGHALPDLTPIPLDGTDLSLAADKVSPWMGQSFWWLPDLAEPDASVMLPIVGGVVAMINAEMAGRKAKGQEGGEGREGREASAAAGEGTGSGSESAAGQRPVVGAAAAAPVRPVVPGRPRPAAAPRSVQPAPRTPTPSTKPRHFSSTPSTSAPTTPPPTKPKTFKRAPAQYVSPTLAQARQRARAQQQQQQQQHMTSITPEEELRKEKDKASLRQRFMTNVLRGAAVVFVPFAAQVPAALALYWTTSMVFTMGQNLLLDKLDERRKLSVAAAAAAAATAQSPAETAKV